MQAKILIVTLSLLCGACVLIIGTHIYDERSLYRVSNKQNSNSLSISSSNCSKETPSLSEPSQQDAVPPRPKIVEPLPTLPSVHQSASPTVGTSSPLAIPGVGTASGDPIPGTHSSLQGASIGITPSVALPRLSSPVVQGGGSLGGLPGQPLANGAAPPSGVKILRGSGGMNAGGGSPAVGGMDGFSGLSPLPGVGATPLPNPFSSLSFP